MTTVASPLTMSCVACRKAFEEPKPPMPLDLLIGEKRHYSDADHLQIRCPHCGHRQDRSQRYFGFFAPRHVRAFLLVLLLSIISGILFIGLRGGTW
jgi:DNA-directed RNA polymerase subunit RPC12/RpoP